MNEHDDTKQNDQRPAKGDAPDERVTGTRPQEEFEKCATERQEYLEGWQRAKADFLNYKKEEGKRFEDLAQFITTGLIQDLLPALDSFDLALRSFQFSTSGAEQHVAEQGILLIRSQLTDVLKKRGLEIISTEGQKFDPNFHEAIAEAESEKEEGTIVEEIQKGYLLRGRVIRPARVRIVKQKASSS